MNRVICGMTGVLLVAGLAACNDDPGVKLSGDPTAIQATPTVMFINDSATKNLLLRLVDDANYSVPAGPYTISNVGPGLTVVRDSTYRPNYTTGELKQPAKLVQQRYMVTANLPTGGPSGFTVSHGSISQDITVTIIPSTLGDKISYSNASPAAGESVTVTAVDFVFEDDVEFNFDGTDALVLSVAPDGSSAEILPPTGISASAVVSNFHLAVLPAVSFSGTSSAPTLTVGAATTLPNTANPGGSSPQIMTAAPGSYTWLIDAASFTGADIIGAGGPLAWYHVVNSEEGSRTFNIDWDNGADIDAFLTDDAVANFVNTSAATSNHPEHFDQALEAGTNYWLVNALYSGDPPTVTITIK